MGLGGTLGAFSSTVQALFTPARHRGVGTTLYAGLVSRFLFGGENTLIISTEQLDQLRDSLAAGITGAGEQLGQLYASDSGAHLRACHCCSLASFADGAIRDDDDLIAGAMVRFEGGISGSALLALDPENALEWLQASKHDADPIPLYLEMGQLILAKVATALAARFGAEVVVGDANLKEDSVAAVLLQTHASSDTAVISCSLELAAGDCVLPAYVYLLMEPKRLGCALASA